jgi:hypothetical protein
MATYTILTADSSPRLAWLHDRMPVLLTDKQQVEAWLGGKDQKPQVRPPPPILTVQCEFAGRKAWRPFGSRTDRHGVQTTMGFCSSMSSSSCLAVLGL